MSRSGKTDSTVPRTNASNPPQNAKGQAPPASDDLQKVRTGRAALLAPSAHPHAPSPPSSLSFPTAPVANRSTRQKINQPPPRLGKVLDTKITGKVMFKEMAGGPQRSH